ncbi:hypothetical protein QT23_00330, partial [Staphylococcus aureus]
PPVMAALVMKLVSSARVVVPASPELQPTKINEMKTHMKFKHHIHWAAHPPVTSTPRHSAR